MALNSFSTQIKYISATQKSVHLGRGDLNGTGARLSPNSPVAAGEVNWQHLAVWEPKCPFVHLLFPPYLPFFFFLHLYFPPMGAAAPDTHMVTPVWLQAANTTCVSVCMWDIVGSMEIDRAARPPAVTVVPREMWADRLASLCQSEQCPQGGLQEDTGGVEEREMGCE